VPDRTHLVGEFSPQWQKTTIDDNDFVFGVIRNVPELVGVQAQIERMHDRADGGNPEICFEVRLMIPTKRRDTITGFDTEPDERMREFARATIKIRVRRALQAFVGATGHDFGTTEKRPRTREKMREGQGKVHHAAREHSISPSGD